MVLILKKVFELNHSCLILLVIFLITSTFVIFKSIDRYTVVGNEMIVDPAFSEDLDRWKLKIRGNAKYSIENGAITLTLDDKSQAISASQYLNNLDHISHVRLSGMVKTENVTQGEKSWHSARLVLASKSRKGKWLWNLPHEVTELNGTNDWNHYSGTFKIFDYIELISPKITIAFAPGSMSVRDVSLLPVEERAGFTVIYYLLLLCWLFIGLLIFYPISRSSGGNWLNISVAITAALILLLVTLPAQLVKEVKTELQSLMEDYGSTKEKQKKTTVQKINLPKKQKTEKQGVSLPEHEWELFHKGAHIAMLASLALLTFLVWPKVNGFILITDLALFSAAAEAVQLFPYGRNVEFIGFFSNLLGVLAGWLVYKLIMLFRQKAKDAQLAS